MKIDYLNLKHINDMHHEEISSAINHVLDSGWYLQGEQVATFEHTYASYIGSKHCVSCGNGLDALKLILKGEQIKGKLQPGDEIIVPANTYIATLLAITECGLIPVLVEPDITTLQIDDQLIEAALTKHTRAIMLVHLYGRCAMTDKIKQICQQYNLLLFEDNAQAHGCTCADGRKTGSLGDAAAHSFYPGKNLGALGDAGAVTTNDEELSDIIRALANYGSSQKYVFPYRGINSRMDELQASVLIVKLKYLEADNRRRKELANQYISHIDNGNIYIPWKNDAHGGSNPQSNVYHVFPILTPHRKSLQAYLSSHQVGTMIHYPIPPHKQQCYQEWASLPLPVTEKIHAEELSLPCNQALKDIEVEEIIRLVNQFQP